MKRKLLHRIANPVYRILATLQSLVNGAGDRRSLKRAEINLRKIRSGDRQQWRRWYQVNRRRQRQLRALKQLGGGPINSNTTGLPRYYVP